MESHSVPPQHRDALAHGILRANVELWETIRRRTLGEFPPIDTIQESSLTRPTPSDEPEVEAGPKLSDVLPSFIAFMSNEKGWRGQTLAQNQATYRMFIECCGDLPIQNYKRSDLTRFYDLLRALPALYAKRKAWRGKTLSSIVEETAESEIDRLSMKTVKRHFTALGRLFTYLKRRGEYEGENPAHGFEFPAAGRARNKRAMWEGDALRELFNSPIWSGCESARRRAMPGAQIIKDEKYWLPLLGLYHGNRLEEFCQLTRADVRMEDGICYLDINDEGVKQLKNEQSKRRVPLHPKIRALGFLDYVSGVAVNPTDPLFPQLRPGGPDQKLGYYFSKWWGLYRRAIGVYARGLDYHSFRGGVTTKLIAAGISREIRNELLGHEGTSTDERVYFKGLPLQLLYDAICTIEWPEVDTLFPSS